MLAIAVPQSSTKKRSDGSGSAAPFGDTGMPATGEASSMKGSASAGMLLLTNTCNVVAVAFQHKLSKLLPPCLSFPSMLFASAPASRLLLCLLIVPQPPGTLRLAINPSTASSSASRGAAVAGGGFQIGSAVGFGASARSSTSASFGQERVRERAGGGVSAGPRPDGAPALSAPYTASRRARSASGPSS